MKTRTAGTITALIVGIFSATAVYGTDYYLKSGVTDWSQASSYCTDSARTQDSTVTPGENDVIYAPSGTFTLDSSTATGLASIETISNVYEIMTSEGTTLDFVIPSGEVGIGCRIRNNRTAVGVARTKSTIMKRGAGVLDLQATTATEGDGLLYAANLDIKAGTLKVAQGTLVNQRFGALKLASGATIWLPWSPSNASQSNFDRIMAEEGSVITNASTRSSGHSFNAEPASGVYDFESYVKGQMCGRVRIWSYGNIRLEGTNNTMPTVTTMQSNNGYLYSTEPGRMRGVLLVKSIGNKGEPSSVGTNEAFYGYANGSGYRYIGFGETANKNYCLYGLASNGTASTSQFFLDGGPNGGLIHTGSIRLFSDSGNPPSLRRLWLIGEHTNECVIGGAMGTLVDSGVTYPVYLTKSGTGTWRLTGSREHLGVTAVTEGTLRFDSIAERGLLCALGRSTILTPDDSRAIANGDFVGYAFVLGGGATDAIFEYTGAGPGRCMTRPLVLAGNGGHLRASAGELTFYGISPRDANSSPTLTLDGTAEGCKAYNVTNGAAGASMDIVKDGTGTWTLGGNLDVGGIKVKGGTLSLDSYKEPQYADYKWFRISIAQIGFNTNQQISIRKISLFNSAGVRQNAGLTVPAGVTAYTNVPAATARTVEALDIGKGEIWYDKALAGKTVNYVSNSSDLDALCNNVFKNDDGNNGTFVVYTPEKPKTSSAATWFPIVMRLPDSADPIAKFDIQAFSNSSNQLPTRVMVEASHDGNIWECVFSNIGDDDEPLVRMVSSYNKWLSDGTGSQPTAASNTARASAPSLSASGGIVRDYFTWYRLRIAKLGSGNTVHFRQIGLFDKNGRRLNTGLTLVEGPGEPGTTYTIVGTMPGPGQVGYGYTGIGHQIKCDDTYLGQIEACFNGVYEGSTATSGRCAFKWLDSAGNTCTPNPANESTWIPIVMHLSAPAAVHHFDIEAFNNTNLDSAPVRFMLEGSTDGETWHVLYNNATEGEALSNNPTGYNEWLSDLLYAPTHVNRPDGTGWNIGVPYLTENPYEQFANGLKVQVLSDGVLSTTGTLELDELTIDATDAGAIESFAFAQNGVLNLVNVSSSMMLPGTYAGCSGLENVANWTVKIGGRVRTRTRVVAVDGRLKVLVPGTAIGFR